ncbi:hypothetical protein [Streptomyces sp. NPDC101455]|uniref:hypothetical protein n=1 Tax=Streptomyces sp. NPDC101455 TaxID=3366142 RepID=UPI003821076F
MRTYRYKVQTRDFGLFIGIAADTALLDAPPVSGEAVSERVWLDAADVQDVYRGGQLALNEREIEWLRLGLRKVADSIELIESTSHVLVTLRALEIVEADYSEVALAPALARWMEAEFGLAPRRCGIARDSTTGQLTIDWDE